MAIATDNFDRAVIEFEKMNRTVRDYELEDVHFEHPVVRALPPPLKAVLKANMQFAPDEEQPKIVTWTVFSLAPDLTLTQTSRSEVWFSPDTDMMLPNGVTLVSKAPNGVDSKDLQADWDTLPEDMREMSRLFAPEVAQRFDPRLE